MKIGLLGGAFNPVHQGHHHLAALAQSCLNLDVLHWSMGRFAFWKDDLLPFEIRLHLLRLALEETPLSCPQSVLLYEAARHKRCFTLETLLFLKRLYGPKAEIVLIIGDDQWKRIVHWYAFSSIIGISRLFVGARAGEIVESLNYTQERLKQRATIQFAPMELPIASTQIREALRLADWNQINRWMTPRAAGFLRRTYANNFFMEKINDKRDTTASF